MLQENKIRQAGAEVFWGDYVPPDIRQLRELQTLIEQHFREMRGLEFYSGRLKLSVKRLNTITRAHLGLTAYELVQQRLHAEAVKLLLHTTLSVKQIAYELDMNDPAYFCRCFKRITGMSPGQFRKAKIH